MRKISKNTKSTSRSANDLIFILISLSIVVFLLYCMYVSSISSISSISQEKENNSCIENFYDTHTPSFFTTFNTGEDQTLEKKNGYWILPSPSSSDENGESYVDESKELKNLCTDFVTHYFFATDDTIYEFMNLTIHSLETMLKEKRFLWNVKEEDMFLVYKGGNILRKVFSNFMESFPELVRTRLFDYFSPYFKRSDMDFSIYIRPSLPDYSPILLDVERGLLNVERKIRSTFENNPTRFFNYYQYSESYQLQLLNNLFKTMEKASVFTDPSNSLYYKKVLLAVSYDSLVSTTIPLSLSFDSSLLVAKEGREDLEIRFVDPVKSEGIKIRTLPKNGKHKTFISDNRALKFSKTNGGVIEFDLIRTKVDFGMVLISLSSLETWGQHMNGELLDVSLPKGEQAKQFFKEVEDATFSDFIVPYTLHYMSDMNLEGSVQDKTVHVFGYTLSYLREDLTRILFEDAEFPWEDAKYTKRLHRLFLLHFINLYIESRNRKLDMELIYEAIVSLSTSSDPMEIYRTLSSHFGISILSFNSFLEQIALLSKRVNNVKNKEFSNMMKVLEEDAKTCLEIFADLDQYFIQNAPVLRKSIYN